MAFSTFGSEIVKHLGEFWKFSKEIGFSHLCFQLSKLQNIIFQMESFDLGSNEKSPFSRPRSPLGDLSNSPKSNSNQSGNSDEKDNGIISLNLNSDGNDLLGLIEEKLDKVIPSCKIRQEKVDENSQAEKDKDSSSNSQEQENQEKDSESICSVQGQPFRNGKAHQSIFKRQLNRQESRNQSKITVYLEHELTDRNFKGGQDLVQAINDSQVILEGKNSDSLTKILLAMSNMANQHKFQIVRYSEQELLIRKKKEKSIIEQLLFMVKEPMVLQLVLDYRAGKAWLFRVAGDLTLFRQFSTELQGKLWQAGELVLSQDQELHLFLCKYQLQLQRLRDVIVYDPLRIKTVSDRRKTDLQKYFNKVMDLRDGLLTQMHKKGLSSHDCVLELDRFLLNQSGLMDSYKQHFKLLEYSYSAKKKSIVANISLQNCLEYLEVQEIQELLAATEGCGLGRPYQRIMQEFMRLDNLGSPEEKLNCLIDIYKDTQECCNNYHHGRVSLQKMDNMLPILIYIVLYTEAINLLPNLALLQHYVAYKENASGNYEVERRILTNLNVALEYVITSWDYPKKS